MGLKKTHTFVHNFAAKGKTVPLAKKKERKKDIINRIQ